MNDNEVHILVGLPGSGKTTYAEQQKNMSTLILYVDDEIKRIKRLSQSVTIKKALLYAMGSANVNLSYVCRYEKIIVDGLFLRQEEIEQVITFFTEYLDEFKVFIHQWNEDRDTCIKNDQWRREETSLGMIRNAEYKKIDLVKLQEYFKDNSKVTIHPTIISHLVELKPEWARKYGHIVDAYGKLKSREYFLGGVSGNCWDSSMSYLDGEEIKPFTELYDFLEAAFPYLLLKDWNAIEKEVVSEERWSVPEYYGGSSKYFRWVCDVKKVYELLGL